MKLITYIYVFALYVLCSPGFFIKTKMNITNYMLHGVVFSVILYFTIGLVNHSREFFDQSTLSVKGLDHLVNLINAQKQQKQTNIDIQNEIKGMDDTNNQCWDALGKSQKELEVLRVQLDSYDGSIENIDKLNAAVIVNKEKILTLQKQMDAYNGDKNSLENLTKQFNNYKDQFDALNTQILAYDGTEESLDNLNKKLTELTNTEQTLTTNLNTCNSNTTNLTNNVTNLQNTYNNNQNTIASLQQQISSKSYCS